MFEQVALPTLKQAIGVDQDLLQRQQVNGSNQFVRGWNSADIGEDANTLMWKANEAAISGDRQTAAVLKQQSTDLMRQAQQWAPTVQNLTDVNSVESLGDWAGGAMGNLRSSVKPALGGLAGAAIGAVAAPFTGGVINPLLGARVGAGLAGYNTMTEGNAADMMMDSGITSTPQEIANAARGAGAVQGVLESVVPAGVAGSVVGLGGRKAAAEIAKNGLLKTAGKRIGVDAAEEFATEFAQNPVGDIAKNYLKGEDLTNIDWKAAVNAGAAGAVGGAGMGAMGAGADALHAQLGKGVDKAKEIKNDPLGAVLDAGVDLAAKAGTAKAKLENYFDERELKKQGFTDDQIAEKKLEELFGGKHEDIAAPHTPDEKMLDPMVFDGKRKEAADRKAADILKSNSQTVHPDIRQAATDYASGKIDWLEFGKRENDSRKTQSVVDDADDALAALEGRKSKKSLMRPTLTDDFGEQEGRDMDNDKFVDDYGYHASIPVTSKDNTKVSTTPYTGDTFSYEAGKEPSISERDVSEPATFNYDSLQRTGAIDKAKNTDNSNSLTSEVSPAVQQVAKVREEIYKTKTTAAEAIKDRDTVDVAELIVKEFGVNKDLAQAARNTTEKDAHVRTVAGMMSWARFGFMSRSADDMQARVEALVKVYGGSASKLMRKAYTDGVHQGVVPANDEKAAEVEQMLERQYVDSTARYDAVIKNLTPKARAQAGVSSNGDVDSKTIGKLLGVLQDIVSRGEKGGNTKNRLSGIRSTTDKAVLKALFGTDENIRAALEKFVEPKNTEVLKHDNGGTDEQDGSDFSAAVDALEGEVENDVAESGNTINTSATHTDLKRADGKHFDKRDDADRLQMESLRKEHSALKGKDTVVANEVDEIGIVQQAMEGLDTEEARQAAKRDLVHEHHPRFERISEGPAADAPTLLKRDYATRLRKYNRKVNALAVGLDKRFVTLRVTKREMEGMPLDFSRKVVEDLELEHMNLDDPKNGPGKGTLVFELKDKNGNVFGDYPFKTSAPMIMRQMFRLRDKMGDGGSAYKAGVEGTAQGAFRILMDGITSITTAEALGVKTRLPKNPLGYFTGKWGYVLGGKTHWVEGHSKHPLPDNFLIFTDKKLGPQTYGLSIEQGKDQSKKQVSYDFDPEDVKEGIVTKQVATPDEKMRALLSMTEGGVLSPQAIGEIHALSKKIEDFRKILLRDTEAGKKLIAKQGEVISKLAKEKSPEREAELAKLKRFNTVDLYKSAQGRSQKTAFDKQIASLYKQYGLNSTTSEQVAPKLEQERAVDGLAGFDKRGDGALGVRNERGDINSGDDTMLAQAGTIGRSRSGTAPVATRNVGDKIVDERISDNVKPDPVRQVVRKPEEATTTPVSSRAYVELTREFAGKVRGVTTEGWETINNRLREMPALGELMGNILTTAVAVGDEGLNGAYMLAQPLDNLGGYAVILSERADADAKSNSDLFKQEYAHEVGHSLASAGVFDLAKDFARDGEMAAEAKSTSGKLKETLRYPMGKSDEVLESKGTDFASEFHATLFGLYQNKPSELKAQMPKTFATLESIYGEEGSIKKSSSLGVGATGGESSVNEGGNGDKQQGRSDSEGASSAASGQIAKDKLIKQLESVKTYTPRHRAAVRNALAILKGTKEGDLNQALEAVFDSSEYFGKKVQTEAQSEIAEMNEAVADAADDYYEYERSREDSERDYSAEYEASQEVEYEGDVVEEAQKQSPEAEQLQAYIDSHGTKNVSWANAARKAIAENKTTQITGALAAAKRQFGETKGAVNVEKAVKTESNLVEAQHTLPMSYKIHNLADIRPELRSKYRQGAGIAELIANGDRTATTRAVPTGVKAGSIIRFPGVEGTYKVTSIEKIDLNSKEGIEAWSKKEGWDTSMVKGFGNQVRHGATQITFERIKNSAQRPGANPKNKEEFEASVAQAAAHIIFTIGKNIKVDFEKMTDGSGSWTEGQTVNTIKLALNGDVLGAAFHESFHEFMNILKKNGGGKTSDVLKRAAMNPIIQRKLEILLNGHPEAIKQLADPEEAAAFMYQFWSAGLLKIGPDTKSAFTTVKNFLKRVAAVFSEIFRKEVEAMSREQMEAGHAEQLLREFAGGAVSNMDTRKMIVEAMEKSTELHDAAVERVGETFQKFANTAGKLVMSSEAMMEATGNKHMVDIVRGFHQKVGTAMQKVGKSVGSYSDGLRQATSHWVHKVEAVLDGYTAEEIEMAREAMSKEIEPTDRVAKELVAKINAFYAEMAQYMEAKDVRRLNMERTDPKTGTRGAWEKIPLRKNYLPQVWSIDALMKDFPAFKADLLKHHMKELQNIADEANKELKDMKGVKKGTAAGIELDRAEQEFKDSGKVMAKLNLQTITPEMVADAIGTRLLASNGHIEINESNSGLGITPAASAVNKRELNWLNKEVFDKYKEKDLTSIMTTYAHSIVKRGEYQSRFGHGGEKIAEGADKAILHELGGDALVNKAEAHLDDAIDEWKKAKADSDGDFDEPFPTLRSVGQKMHVDKVGKEKHDEALLKTMKKLENGFNAIQALEGTLGRDITPNARAVNSWIVTYQSFRTLSTMLFTSFQDVAGIVVNGGEARDAWDGFVEGIREVRNTVFNKKDPSAAVQAAEFWGTVDSGAYLESTAQAQGSPFMSGKAKQWSDTFFKYTGAVGWNRGVRSVATKVAERIITEWKTNGIDTKDKAAVARLEDLFGKGFDPANIKTNPDGTLDRNDLANQAAVTRWVLTAVPAPTAAHRTIWMSDPHYAVFAQLKNYTYSFHRIMMKNAADQARLGNYRPVMAMMLGYAPIAIAAGAIKEMLIPGEEPPWMKGGLDGYLNYGFSRAGVLGVPQMFLGSVIDVSEVPGLNLGKAGSAFDPAALAGPTVDQVQNILSVPFGEFMAMRDHTIIGEGLGALPGGNVLKRIERLGSA